MQLIHRINRQLYERSLLPKGVNFIPAKSVTDEFHLTEENERFFRRLRLKAPFHESSKHAHGEAHGNQLIIPLLVIRVTPMPLMLTNTLTGGVLKT